MATVASTDLTLLDLAKRMDPNGKTATIVELLSQTNTVVQDATMVEGNGPTHNRTTVRTSLPTAAWRQLNDGVANSKSTSAQVDDGFGMLETYSEVDKSIVDLAADPGAFRLSEDIPFIEGMNNEMEATTFYGDTDAAPQEFMGFMPRFNSLSGANAAQIIMPALAPTGGDAMSIWFVTWSPRTVFLAYPKGGTLGLMSEDLGQVTLTGANGGQYEGYRTHYKWDLGLVVRDWRHVVRLQQDSSVFQTGSTSNSQLVMEDMIRAYSQLENPNAGRSVIYMNRSAMTWLTIHAQTKANVNLTIENYAGKPILSFFGLPIRRTDALTNTEATIV